MTVNYIRYNYDRNYMYVSANNNNHIGGHVGSRDDDVIDQVCVDGNRRK